MSDFTKKPLRVLSVEDSEDDAKLLVRELQRGGFDVSIVRVDTADAMREALTKGTWDVVISDYTMPEFSALGALSVLREFDLDLAFIITSGTIDEETAVEVLRAGAHDFVVKHRMARLCPAIERGLRDAAVRRERQAAQQAADAALKQKMRAEAANEAKSKLFASVTHELRTPLNAILGFSELLQQGLGGPLTPQQAEYVNNVLLSGHHLLQLINDVLDLSKIEAGKIELSRTVASFAPLAQEVCELLQPLADKKKLLLLLSIDDVLPPLSADPTRLRQILFNLVSNAIKFTGEGGMIRVTARLLGSTLQFSVEDTGIGIAPEDLPRIFGDFEQLTPSTDGTGLGLAITKKLVELHGGIIKVSSRRGVGTTFTVSLPLRPSLAIKISDMNSLAPRSQSMRARILVVEDDLPSQRLFRAILEGRGHLVIQAASVDEALAQVAKVVPKLVISDMGLPGGGGARLLREMRAHEAWCKVPVLATTASGNPEARERFLAEGFDAFVSKPLDIAQFAATVDALLAAKVV